MKAMFFVLALLYGEMVFAQSTSNSQAFKPVEVYHSEALLIIQIAENTFLHTSYLQTNDFGNVGCNGIFVRNGQEVIVFDTPTNDTTATDLIKFIQEKLHCTINAVVPTHFHDDCLGGLAAFHQHKIPSFANVSTIELTKAHHVVVPQNGFKDSLRLRVGNTHAMVTYFGEGHTKDNVVGYFPGDNVLFGGCMIKALQATKGYLGDANVVEWSNTVKKVKQHYPHVKTVVPGHGAIGGTALLDYTIQLFKTN